MPGRAVQELQRVTDWQDDDLFYVVRFVGGTAYDRSIARSDLFGRQIRRAVLNLSSTELLALNTTPQQIVAAPGAGKVILPLNGVATLAGVGTPYATNVAPVIGGAANVAAGNYWSGFPLNASADATTVMNPKSAGLFQIEENEALVLKEPTGDPTAGDASLQLVLWYVIEEI